jgi:hypothetical protein
MAWAPQAPPRTVSIPDQGRRCHDARSGDTTDPRGLRQGPLAERQGANSFGHRHNLGSRNRGEYVRTRAGRFGRMLADATFIGFIPVRDLANARALGTTAWHRTTSASGPRPAVTESPGSPTPTATRSRSPSSPADRRADRRPGMEGPAWTVSRTLLVSSPWQRRFHEDFWCCEGFVALSHEKVFMIMV